MRTKFTTDEANRLQRRFFRRHAQQVSGISDSVYGSFGLFVIVILTISCQQLYPRMAPEDGITWELLKHKRSYVYLIFIKKYEYECYTYETRSCDMSIKSRLLNSAIPPQSSSRGVLCVIIEFWVFMFLNTLIIQESNSVGSFC